MSPPEPRHADAAPRILVLLATYDGREWIEAQIETILAQRGVSIRLLISDDGSRDGTDAIVNRLASSDHRVRVLEAGGASGSAGANFRRLFRAAELHDADYVALADQDDLWLEDKLLRAVDCLGEAQAEGYSSTVMAFWPDGRERDLGQDPRPRAADFLFEGAGQGCTFVVTSGFFREVQAFCREHPAQSDALHYHDWLIYLLARATGLRWVFDPQSRIRYRQHQSNEIGARGGLAAARHRLQKIRDGWYRKQVEAAIDAHAATGGHDEIVQRFAQYYKGDMARGVKRRLGLALMLGRYSRRRSGDRAMLVLAALFDWL